jgi:iturin family lipopeptide synthetase B
VEEQTNYPLTIVVTAGQQLTVDFCYYADLLPAVVVQRIQAHFAHVLRQIVYQPDLRLDQLELVTEEEKRQLLVDFNDTAAAYPQDGRWWTCSSSRPGARLML